MATIEELQARLSKVEARLREVEDEREIRELLARYGVIADRGVDAEYLELWTDDGVMDVQSKTYGKVLRFEGRKGLEQFIADPKAHHNPDWYSTKVGNRMHVQGTNVRCRINGDEAIVNSYSIVLMHKDKEPFLYIAGSNAWKLRRVDGRWRIQELRRRRIGTEEFLQELADA